MIEFYYNSYAIACYIVSQEMGTKSQMDFLEKLYNTDHEYLRPEYRIDKKDFFSDVLKQINYLIDNEKLNKEFPAIKNDFIAAGRSLYSDVLMSDFQDVDQFFMLLRLHLKYSDGKSYVRMKLRTLLKRYGYERRSELITSHIRDCMMFYHIQSYLKGEVECDIKEIDLDDMITFKIL